MRGPLRIRTMGQRSRGLLENPSENSLSHFPRAHELQSEHNACEKAMRLRELQLGPCRGFIHRGITVFENRFRGGERRDTASTGIVG